ncbi:hypothetical protein SDJN02_11721 [Cucurbita argyrosperma subsp. argyrosperma]|nr:hypothetical protein SDJN02_11721 [Cucurbita argyrosperma subsp. argyrosperma]
MKSPDTAAITHSLQHSFPTFSPNHRLASSSSSSFLDHEQRHHQLHTTLDLNSHISLPSFWEQCLHLKFPSVFQTGEVYYTNCRTGMRVKEDPRRAKDLYSEDDDDDDESSSDEGSEESCSSSSYAGSGQQYPRENEEEVLVVAGCKRCFMYFMVPKQVEGCPKCSSSRLVHFDRTHDNNNGFP